MGKLGPPIPTAALDDRLGFTGTSGSGKTYNAGTAAERLLARKSRIVVVDPLGVWYGLRLLADGKTPSPYNVVIFGGAHGDLPLNDHAGGLLGETVAGMAESCILDLSGLGTKAGERRFMLAFLTALYRHVAPEPLHLIIDEADMFAPQTVRDKDGEAVKLLGMMETVVRRGRSKGFIPWLITQRPAVLNKDVLSQVDGLVAFKLTSSQDRDAIGNWVEGQADKAVWHKLYGALATFQRGHGLVWVPGRGVMKDEDFPPKLTFDSSATPKRGERIRAAALKPLNLATLRSRLASVEKEVVENDSKRLKAEVARLTRELAAKQPLAKGIDRAEMRAEINKTAETAHARGYGEAIKRLAPLVRKLRALTTDATSVAEGIEKWAGDVPIVLGPETAPSKVERPISRQTTIVPTTPRMPSTFSTIPNSEVGQGGLRRILVVLAQRPEGLTTRQIGVRARLSSKSGTFNTYVSKARSSGWVTGRSPLVITEAGIAALGDYDPLPTGRDLLDYWLRELGDSGSARLLRAIAEVYPNTITTVEAGERANLSHQSGTFGTYLSRLRSLELIEGRGELRAADELF
jgi:hypothetical protein